MTPNYKLKRPLNAVRNLKTRSGCNLSNALLLKGKREHPMKCEKPHTKILLG
ncbi:MAG: hypothetical protein AVDCRST_MAG86-2411 [uncultured Truepera sp.]|uniref:Uncharacterized protein n=1 Tax=uncultured Truepera sp. TaxID=543023 RepID=A0A6J4VFY1_9DEIN|nr:MAG: hypothetical protein AVDCRST_MAG86-2411 [uncultured Truepera sp.]